MKKLKTILIVLLASVLGANGETPVSHEEIHVKLYNAYLSSLESFWTEGIEKCKALYKEKATNSNKFLLAYAKYGILGFSMKDKDHEIFDNYSDNTENLLKELIEEGFKPSEATALLSSITGYRIGYSSWKGIFLGPKSSSLIEEAMESGKSSPIVWKLYGDSKFFTPAMFGGDTDESIKAYQKAIELYESNNDTRYNWMYLDAFAWLGQAYLRSGQKDRAISIYKKVLEIEPDFRWVKNVLLPRAQEK